MSRALAEAVRNTNSAVENSNRTTLQKQKKSVEYAL